MSLLLTMTGCLQLKGKRQFQILERQPVIHVFYLLTQMSLTLLHKTDFHSHKKQKDSLEVNLVRVLFTAKLEFRRY